MSLSVAFLWIDQNNNWHIINHAYNTGQFDHCEDSAISSHIFSRDGKAWHSLPKYVQPYSSRVHYSDGTSRVYATQERPNLFGTFDDFGRLTQPTHLTNAADGAHGNAGCKAQAPCQADYGGRLRPQCHPPSPCVNCKWLDKADTIIRMLNVA
eukprot:SAG25_NODE_392_length_8604_cov_13.605879_2_plen_153_part_00